VAGFLLPRAVAGRRQTDGEFYSTARGCMAGFDPEQSFVHEPRSGHSVAVGKDIQGARRAARRHFQHVRVDHGRRYVRMPQQLLHSSDTLAQLVQNPGGQQHKDAGFDGIFITVRPSSILSDKLGCKLLAGGTHDQLMEQRPTYRAGFALDITLAAEDEATRIPENSGAISDMKYIFNPLYDLHPLLPIFWLLLLGNGLLAPAIFSTLAKIPYDIGKIWRLARDGSKGAKYAVWSWAVLVVATLATFMLAALR